MTGDYNGFMNYIKEIETAENILNLKMDGAKILQKYTEESNCVIP